MNKSWFPVHTIDGWYDGPREGAAGHQDGPVWYRSIYLDDPDDYRMNEDRFELTSITDEVLKWMIERDGIFQRWDSARKAGTISWKPGDDETSYGALPDEMDRCRDLNLKIETFLKETMPAHFVYGDFEIESPVRTRVRWRTVLSDSGVR